MNPCFFSFFLLFLSAPLDEWYMTGSSFSPHFDCGLWKSTKILGWVGVEPHNLFLSNKRGFCDLHISICMDERDLTFLPFSCQMYHLDSMNVMGRNSQKAQRKWLHHVKHSEVGIMTLRLSLLSRGANGLGQTEPDYAPARFSLWGVFPGYEIWVI